MFSQSVKKIGITNVGRQVPKPGVVYPIIRLPQNYAHTIGEEISIYETEFGGGQSFLIVFEKGVVHPVAQPIVQPVTQPVEKSVQLVALFFNNKMTDVIEHQRTWACGLAGYDVALTWRRSGVQISSSPLKNFIF
jgi:hypothetical protein